MNRPATGAPPPAAAGQAAAERAAAGRAAAGRAAAGRAAAAGASRPARAGVAQSGGLSVAAAAGASPARGARLAGDEAGGAPFNLLGAPILEPPQGMATEMLLVILSRLRSELGDRSLNTQKLQIEAHNRDMQARHQETIKKIDEQIKQMEKARHMSPIQKAFAWIGAVLGMIAAGIATAFTGGAAAPLLVMAVVSVVMLTLEETGAMEKIVAGLAKAFAGMLEGFGVDSEQAKKIGQYMAAATVAVAVIAANIVAVVASGGAELGETAAMVMTIVRTVEGVIGGGTMLAGAGVNAAQTVYRHEADMARADQARIKAALAVLSARRDQLVADISKIIQALEQMESAIPQALADQARAEDTIISHMRHPA